LSIQNNSKLYFVYLPKYQRYKLENNDKEYNLVKNIVGDLKIPFIDIHEKVFQRERDPLKLFSFSLNFHYTKEGYRKVSKSIFKFIKNYSQ
jgi:lysophospholipase L1-like esterase